MFVYFCPKLGYSLSFVNMLTKIKVIILHGKWVFTRQSFVEVTVKLRCSNLTLKLTKNLFFSGLRLKYLFLISRKEYTGG